jgi:hypothetical protein
METAPTIDMTEAPSSSYDEGSLCETYMSSINRAKVSEVASHDDRKLDPFNTDLSTPRFLIALSKFKNPSAIFVSSAQSENGSDIGDNHDDDATLNLLEKAEQLFSAHSREDPVTPSSPMWSRVDSGSSITQSKFDQIMAKYENMSVNENEYKAGIHNINNRSESLLESITPCHDSCGYPSARLNKLHTPQIKLPASTQEYGFSKNLSPPKSHLRERPQILDPPEMLELLLQPSFTESNEAFSLCIRQVRSFGSDAVSALSMLTGNTTVGSVSISTENSAVIESHVQAIVHNIVACEVENAGSMKKELEAALKDKLKLKAKVNKLVKTSDEQSLLLAANHIKRGKFNREMEIQLARKAAELKKCTAVALNQAEESKRRALELAQQDMEKEISLLRSQLDAVQSIGVPIDRTLRDALGLVELNQRALRKAAERDAKSALEMKEEIEQSFVNAVMEFEAWSEKQLRLMESRWERFKT